MRSWPYELVNYSPEEVQRFCVRDESWQIFRKRLKGLSTERKLDELYWWMQAFLLLGPVEDARKKQVQISNYINALKRGGQLDMEMKVQR